MRVKHYFQASLDAEGRPCLIVGGGAEAEEKAGRLLEAGAVVTVVSPVASPQLQVWSREGRLVLHSRVFETDDLDGVYLTVNTVKGDPALSRQIYERCEAKRILISAYDQPDVSNFVMVALVRSGWLRVALATGATSPALASRLRQELEQVFDGAFARFTEYLAEERREIESRLPKGPGRSEALRHLVRGLRVRAHVEYPPEYLQHRETQRRLAPPAESVGPPMQAAGLLAVLRHTAPRAQAPK